jgi:FkbH-like protein
LGVSSFVFIDDNPIEVGAVQEVLGDVAVVQMPEDPSQWSRVVAGSRLLDRLPPTGEDLGRAEGYRVETERRELRSVMTVEQYRRTLDVQVTLADPQPSDVARLAQLVAKTNQFSIGSPRHPEATLASMLSDPRWSIRLVSAKDRFGDYGVVGVTITERPIEPGQPGRLDTFVLSCRAMGRGVEEAMIADAVQVGDGAVAVQVIETTKNLPGRTFFSSLGADAGNETVLREVQWPEFVRRA